MPVQTESRTKSLEPEQQNAGRNTTVPFPRTPIHPTRDDGKTSSLSPSLLPLSLILSHPPLFLSLSVKCVNNPTHTHTNSLSSRTHARKAKAKQAYREIYRALTQRRSRERERREEKPGCMKEEEEEEEEEVTNGVEEGKGVVGS